MQKIYPTKEEILAELPNFKPSQALYATLNGWRKAGRGTPLTHARLTTLVQMLYAANHDEECGPGHTVPLPSLDVVVGHEYMTDRWSRRIILGSKPSIISSLHELGHILHGSSELKACAFSIALFKAVYPRSYKALEWKGHMLVKRRPMTAERDLEVAS